MGSDASEVLKRALALPPGDRAELVDALVVSLARESALTLHPEWETEIDRRLDELDQGEGTSLTWEEVEAELRARIRQ
jgi:putative addiction module component (TIGR02574 family)